MDDTTPITRSYLSHPGETLVELVGKRGSQWTTLAHQLDLPIESMIDLMHGDHSIDDVLADRLGQVVGPNKEFWVNRERNYRTRLDEQNSKTHVCMFIYRDTEWVDDYLYEAICQQWHKELAGINKRTTLDVPLCLDQIGDPVKTLERVVSEVSAWCSAAGLPIDSVRLHLLVIGDRVFLDRFVLPDSGDLVRSEVRVEWMGSSQIRWVSHF